MSSLRECHSQCWVVVFIRELHNVHVGTDTHCFTPELALAWSDPWRGRTVVVWLQKQVYQAFGRREKVRCILLWSYGRKYWEAAPEGSLKTGKGPQGPQRSLNARLFSHIHNMTEQVWLLKLGVYNPYGKVKISCTRRKLAAGWKGGFFRYKSRNAAGLEV